MKRFCFVLIVATLLPVCTALAQYTPAQQKAMVLKRMIELKHYAPRPVDDSFAVAIGKEIINNADSRRLLFTAPEYQQLANLSKLIDNELQGGEWTFVDKFSSLYKKAITRADSIINKINQKPFDFTVDEKIISIKRNANTFLFAADVPTLAAKWNRYFKYIILDQVYEDIDGEDSAHKTTLKTALSKQEATVREELKKQELKTLSRITENDFAVSIQQMYLEAVATVFDPHTNYFSPEGKEDFQAALSTEAYYFGINLTENEEGKITVEKLTPGGPAWKTGEINKGDELMSLVWEGKEAKDLAGLTLPEVYDILDQSTHDRLIFRFKKADGTIKMVQLQKEKMESEENIVKSFVLNGDKKIGYILLPGFYTEWENETGSSCANDVAKEIIKLKKEKIDGLIVDVRYNGGGSVSEALEMTGIFIEEGPLTVIKETNGKVITLKDPNRGTIYDGPMALMVNGQSASASEMLAASLQDYNRAVITGSNTFGKATMQAMFAVDTTATEKTKPKEGADMVKITTGKLYRINGSTAQLKGVAPDVALPDAFDGLDMGERFENFALAADSVKRNSYYKPLPNLPLAELKQRSAARLNSNPVFQTIKTIIVEQQKIMQMQSRTIPLKPDLYEKWAQQQAANLQMLEGDEAPSKNYTVENNSLDKKALENNNYAADLNKDWLENLADDIYLQEVYLIVIDLINLQNNTTKN